MSTVPSWVWGRGSNRKASRNYGPEHWTDSIAATPNEELENNRVGV
jgi:hypothetical protein